MRLQLTLSLIRENRILPINYQYEFSAWIYRMIHYGDTDFAEWLHSRGYAQGKRSFKLFTFSNLDVERFNVLKKI
jgi:CRISPR-associated endoribonuclease Cas6